MSKITAIEVLEKFDSLVEKYGEDFIYEVPKYENDFGELVETNNCMYSNEDGTPSCIVGHVLSDVAPELYADTHKRSWKILESREVDAIPELKEIFEEDAISVMSVVQDQQDSKNPWGFAVKLGYDELKLQERLKE